MLTDLVFLCPRVPFPEHRSDTAASYQMLRYLAERHRVHLGTFLSGSENQQQVDSVASLCESSWFGQMDKSTSFLRMLAGFVRGEPVETARLRDPSLKRWLKKTIRATRCKHLVVFASRSARSIPSKFLLDRSNRLVVDFDEFDPEVWEHQSQEYSFPLSAVYAGEVRKQIAFDRRLAGRAKVSVFRSRSRSKSFLEHAPEIAPRVSVLRSGVDRIYFSSDENRQSPFSEIELPIVLTGQLDSLAFADGAKWFAEEVLPMIRKRVPTARFYVLASASRSGLRLPSSADVTVLSDIEDVRPYLQFAKLTVAPQRIGACAVDEALAAMSMGKPLLTTQLVANEIKPAIEGEEFLLADDADKMADLAVRILVQPDIGEAIGANARLRIEKDFDWDRSLAQFENLLLGRNL